MANWWNPQSQITYNPSQAYRQNQWYWQGGTGQGKFTNPVQQQTPGQLGYYPTAPKPLSNPWGNVWNSIWSGVKTTAINYAPAVVKAAAPWMYTGGPGQPNNTPAWQDLQNKATAAGYQPATAPKPKFNPDQWQGAAGVQPQSPWLKWLGQNNLSQFGYGYYTGTPGRTYTNGTVQPYTVQTVAPGPAAPNTLASQGAQPTDTSGGYGSGYGGYGNGGYGYGGGGYGDVNINFPASNSQAQWYLAMTNWNMR